MSVQNVQNVVCSGASMESCQSPPSSLPVKLVTKADLSNLRRHARHVLQTNLSVVGTEAPKQYALEYARTFDVFGLLIMSPGRPDRALISN